MFPFRYSSIFRSRWIALFWAAGIVWMALDVAGSPNSAGGNDADADGADMAQLNQAQKLLQQLGN